MAGSMLLLTLNIYYQVNVIVRTLSEAPTTPDTLNVAELGLDPILTPVVWNK